jgi:hypothetical protein
VGGGLSSTNVMSYGEFPDIANDYSNKSMLMPSGVILNGNLKEVLDVDLKAPDQIQEWVTHSWYRQGDESKGLHPFDGVTEPNFELGKGTKGTRTAIDNIDESAKYSWVKSPRWKGNPVEVGPLARYIVGYARGREDIKQQVDMVLKTLDVPLPALFSTLGRTAARGLEASWAAHRMKYFYDQLIANLKAGDLNNANIEKWESSTWPAESKGVAPCEAPRGALAHWVKIKNERIDSYQCVVPTTWNAGRATPWPDRRVRGGASQHADGQSRAAARDPAHDPQLRSVPRLRIARDVGRGRGDRVGAGALKRCRETAMQIERWTGRVIGGPHRGRLCLRGAGADLALGDRRLPGRSRRHRLLHRRAAACGQGRAGVRVPDGLVPDGSLRCRDGRHLRVLVRIYWAFAGNPHARHLFLPPMWSGAFWRGLGSDVRSYLFISSEEERWVGHNPLALMGMFFMFVIGMVVVIVTGLGLFAQGTGYGSGWSRGSAG